jgi:bleomycin hydrolase
MKNIPILLGAMAFVNSLMALSADPENGNQTGYIIPELKIAVDVPATSVKNQNRTSTCWSFSTLSMIESELLRTLHKEYNLSEMFVIRHVYLQKAERYIRMHGNVTFAGGGEPNDVINAIAQYGIIPEEAYSGLLKDSLKHSHGEMDIALKNYVDDLVSDADKKLEGDWLAGLNSIMDHYLGKIPSKFIYEGREYTPVSFAQSLNLFPEDYVLLSSFSYKTMYQPFVLEVPDNWSWGEVYNTSLNDLIMVIDSALSNGYSVVWSADYSEPGFNYATGLAVVPRELYTTNSKVNDKKLQQYNDTELEKRFFDFKNPVPELEVTDELRQVAFDNYSTTDDHGMHIIGKAYNNNGKPYYLVKNSWGTGNDLQGYLYVTEAYIKYKTISLMVNKNALPGGLRNKLGI